MRDRSTRLAVCCFALLGLWVVGPAAANPGLRALELGVHDLDRAVGFYTETLSFEIVRADAAGTWTLLGNGDARLALTRSSLPQAPDGTARAYINFSVGDLEVASRAVIAAGGRVEAPIESAVGKAVQFFDPFGHSGYLIDHPWDELPPEAPPAVFNVALSVRDVEAAERFYTALGFEVATRDYLPRTLVFVSTGSAQLILHPTASEAAGPGVEAGALLLDADPKPVLDALASAGGATVERTTLTSTDGVATTVEIRDPSGVLVKLTRPPTKPASIAALSPEQAARAFERLKRLAGQWQAKSDRGWSEPITYEVVAKGSVVVESNSFKDAPQNKMYTMFHLDGDRLLATHYCEARNQPRLIATAVSEDGQELTFSYLDGTGLPSRDHGHMDQAVFRFLAPDRFTSRWTWYQEGSEQWLEEIEHRRLGQSTATSAATSP